MRKTLQEYLPSFCALLLISSIYTALVFRFEGSIPSRSTASMSTDPRQHHSQNLTVARKLKAEKLSTGTVVPPEVVVSPLKKE